MPRSSPASNRAIYSQAEFDQALSRSMQRWRKNLKEQAARVPDLEKQVSELTARNSELQAELAELRAQPAPPKPVEIAENEGAKSAEVDTPDSETPVAPVIPTTPADPPVAPVVPDPQATTPAPDPQPIPAPTDDLSDRLAEMARENETLVQQVREGRRDTDIMAGLSAAGCIDLELGRLWASQRAEYDVLKGEWHIGGKPIKEAIEDTLPPYLRAAQITRGGSGAPSSVSPSRRAAQTELQHAEKELEKLEKKARRSGDAWEIVAVQKARKRVDQLKRELR